MELLPEIDLFEFLLWLLRQRRRFRVTGRSMLPLLQPGDELLVNCRTYKRSHPQVGDLVVLQHPDRANLQIIKRVVSVKKDGSCYVLGDNLVESTDSRAFGFVSPELILGKITSRFAGNRE